MVPIFMFSATSYGIVILFSYFLVTNYGFGVSAYIPIVIGQKSVLSSNEIASTPVWQTDPPTPAPHPGYEVSNVGNAGVRASIYWKDSWPLQVNDVFCEAALDCTSNSSVNFWYQLTDPVHIGPSEVAVVKPSSKDSFYFTRLVVVADHSENSIDSEALVHVEYEDGEAGSAGHSRKKRDIAKTLVSEAELVKNIFKRGGTKLPPAIAATGLEALLELFWPRNRTSMWDTFRMKVRNQIDPKIYSKINALLVGPLTRYSGKLEELAGGRIADQSQISVLYMNLAQDLIGFEEKFVISDHKNSEKLNSDLLPLYSHIVMMKAAFYYFGMRCSPKLGLTQQHLVDLKTYFSDLTRSPTRGANQHVSRVFGSQSAMNFTYSKEMHQRNKVKEDGYVPIWNNMLDRPGQKLVVDELYYSEFSGAYYLNEDVLPPSNPDPLSAAGLSNGQYNEIQTFTMYLGNNICPEVCCLEAIIGIKVILKNGDSFEFGNPGDNNKTIEFHSALRINSLIMFSPKESSGSSVIHLNVVKFENNEWKQAWAQNYGCLGNPKGILYTFQKDKYYVASMYAFFDKPPRRFREQYPLFHMGVSFLPLKSPSDSSDDDTDWKEWTC